MLVIEVERINPSLVPPHGTGAVSGLGSPQVGLVESGARVGSQAARAALGSAEEVREKDGHGKAAVEYRVIHLCDEWIDTDIKEGDVVNIVGGWQSVARATYAAVLSSLKPRADKRGGSAKSKAMSHVDIELDDEYAQPNDRADEHKDEDENLWDAFGSQDLPSASQLAQAEAPIQRIILSSSPKHTQNLLVHHPDVLVPVTKVADGASCSRRSLVQDKLRSTGEITKSLLMGNMLHEVLQACLTDGNITPLTQPEPTRGTSKRTGTQGSSSEELLESTLHGWPEQWDQLGNFSAAFVKARVKEQVQTNLESLFALSISTSDAYVDLIEAVRPFAGFGSTYLSSKADAKLEPFVAAMNVGYDEEALLRSPILMVDLSAE